MRCGYINAINPTPLPAPVKEILVVNNLELNPLSTPVAVIEKIKRKRRKKKK
jgi:hypothetical protein